MQPSTTSSFSKIGSSMIGSIEYPFSGQKTLYTNGSTGVYPSGTDANFGTKTETETISKSGTGVVEDACTVNLTLEVPSFLT